MPAKTYEFTTRNVEYLRHGDRRFMARLFVPQGPGPFPAIVELHGGAWCNGDLNECQTYAEALARNGLAVAALDFRHAGDAYPTSLADINYGIRWVKANAGNSTRVPTWSVRPANRAAAISRCSRRCGRTIRATPRSICRPPRRRWMAACAPSPCCGR